MKDPVSYHGKWILTPEFESVENAYLVCSDDKIERITTNRPDGIIVEHDGLILPALVNAHVHLEFSELPTPLGEPGEGFVSWIGKVIVHRNSRDPAQIYSNIEQGLKESGENGVAALGEISTFDWRAQVDCNLDVVDFRELIGFRPEQHDDLRDQIANLDLVEQNNKDYCVGLSPHAPYSINRSSLEHAVRLSSQKKFPLAMHLAESQEELELLRNHRGPFFDLLSRLNLWIDSNFPTQTRPLDFLRLLAKAHRSLVVHGNYLDIEELAFVANNSDVLKLVFCPRTHDFFCHEQYPLDEVSRHGIRLALGTDSRASNPDLSLWNEVLYLFERQQIPPRELLKMGSLHGAEALGLEHRLGSLEKGKRARVLLAPTPDQCDLVKAIVS